MISPKSILSHVPAYIALQRIVGADRLRYRCIDELALAPGDTVIDVGCGPAYYYSRLPRPLVYHGFDTDLGYIQWARQKWGQQATFHYGIFDEAAAADLPPANAIMLLGLLHHLDDDDSRALLDLAARSLAPGGTVIAVDTAFTPGQGRVSRWMSENDRGEHVREPDAFVALAKKSFEHVDGQVVDDATRIPASYWLMRLTTPVVVTT